MGSDEGDNRYFEGETVSRNLYGDPAELRRAEKDRRYRDEADAERWRECKPVIRRLATAFEKWQRGDAVMPSDGMLDAISDLTDLAKQEGK